MPELESQKKLIHETDWNVLIILDACRYDYFNENYSEYLEGRARKVKSEGSATLEWLRKTYDFKYRDIVYISGNPYVNSVETDARFRANEVFDVVVDAWNRAWDSKYETVRPSQLSKITRLARIKYPGKRLISHFMQPHHPYLGFPPVKGAGITHLLPNSNDTKGGENPRLTEKILNYFGAGSKKILNLFLDPIRSYRVGRKIGIIRPRPVEKFAIEFGQKRLLKAYRDNLRTVLEEVNNLVCKLPGKCVITADHGDFLGEMGVYGHWSGSNHSILREVPWLEVEVEQKNKKHSD